MTSQTPHPMPLPRPVTATSNGSETGKERGVALRVFVYVVVAHLLALFIWALFVVGNRS